MNVCNGRQLEFQKEAESEYLQYKLFKNWSRFDNSNFQHHKYMVMKKSEHLTESIMVPEKL